MPEPGLECHGLFSSFLAFIQYQAEKYLFVFVLHGFQVSKLNILYLYFMQKEYYWFLWLYKNVYSFVLA